ncbi:MAG: pyrrolo-quinoline quinone [Acidobacteria bacterium]|nr:MAG: pyrrolo-quinoline quinone [Acidobacteriota bacterium]
MWSMKRLQVIVSALLLAGGVVVHGEDWPEWRGKGRLGIWRETGIVEKFAASGLPILWRTPVKAGYAGPAVANGRVFITDYTESARLRGNERVLALDEKTGKILWTRQWPVFYGALSYNWAIGPRATPTVDGDRVYVIGATGVLLCLNVATGEIIWQKDYVKDYKTDVPIWGITGAPLVDGQKLICLVGGENNAKVVAFDKMTGKEIWRALPSDGEPGYAQPIIFTAGGTRQLIIWHPKALASLDPESGKQYWAFPMDVNMGLTVATPVLSGRRLLVSSFFNGSMMVELDDKEPKAKLLWKGKSTSEIETDGLHALVNTPVIQGDYIYGICSYGQFRCLLAKNGERVWESLEVTKERARWASGLTVQHGDRYFINNDRGELIIATFSPKGFHEISRTQLLKPTSPPGNRRELTTVNWSHPAYANRHIYARNDEEIIAASLAIDGK